MTDQEVVVVNTGRGYKLYDGRGFAYHRDHTRQDKSYWRCELNLRSNKQLKCRARVMTGQDGSVVYNGTPHNHTPIYSSEGKTNCRRIWVVQGCSCCRMVSGMLSQKEMKTWHQECDCYRFHRTGSFAFQLHPIEARIFNSQSGWREYFCRWNCWGTRIRRPRVDHPQDL
jgi:hypothetical protein